jgi:hypothetical protein
MPDAIGPPGPEQVVGCNAGGRGHGGFEPAGKPPGRGFPQNPLDGGAADG